MQQIVSLHIILMLAAHQLLAQAPPANMRIYPSNVTQTEPVITASPTNPNLLFASGRTINTATGFQSEGVYVSTNGGVSWTGTDTCRGQNITNHGGDPGVMIHPDGRFVLTHVGLTFAGVYSHYSTDLGQTWSSAYTISSTQPEDKGGTAMDNAPTSPYYGRLYSAWVRLLSPFPVSFSYSADAASTWSAADVINPSPPARCSGGTIATGLDGRVFVTWAGVASGAIGIEDFAGFASSTNGGVSWNAQQNIFDMNGINGYFPSKGNIRVNGLPQIALDNSTGSRSGWLYIVTTEKNLAPAGSDPDVILHRSTDGGVTWSAGIRVNQDPLNNGKTQYFPAVDVDQYGGVNILFYDDRFTTNDSTGVMLARSTDGGTTWSERTISNHNFKPKPIIGGSSNYQGDHIAVKAVGSNLHALWMDDFSGIYQIWMATVQVGSNSVDHTDSQSPLRFALRQNYPNPFNPATTIQFEIEKAGHVSLQVFDLLGAEVATLVDEDLNAGIHKRVFSPEDLSGGIYFYRLRSGTSLQTNKMVYVR